MSNNWTSLIMALLHFYFLRLLLSFLGAEGAIFTIENKCRTSIWPGIQGGAGKPQLMNGGFELKPGQAINVKAAQDWSGRVWGRSGCSFDGSGRGNCITGDCGGALKCEGAGGQPPASLAEFTLSSPLDYYDVSLVDGYNMPISIVPYGSGGRRGSCKAVKCVSDMNRNCPDGLQVRREGSVVACKSACLAFGKPEYCCTGAYGSPTTCKPSNYSKVFKSACPSAYSYAYDDSSSTFTCNNGANYVIRFC